MLTLRTLLHLTPDARHPRTIARERRLLLLALAAWAIVYLIAIAGAGMKFID